MPTNTERVDRAASILNTYQNLIDSDDDDATLLIDLVADLEHLARANDLRWQDIRRTASNHVSEEIAEAKAEVEDVCRTCEQPFSDERPRRSGDSRGYECGVCFETPEDKCDKCGEPSAELSHVGRDGFDFLCQTCRFQTPEGE